MVASTALFASIYQSPLTQVSVLLEVVVLCPPCMPVALAGGNVLVTNGL